MRKLDNENFMGSAIFAQLLRPIVSIRSILKNDKGSFRMNAAPFRYDPFKQHVFEQLCTVRARLGGKYLGVPASEVVGAHSWHIGHPHNCWLCPFRWRTPIGFFLSWPNKRSPEQNVSTKNKRDHGHVARSVIQCQCAVWCASLEFFEQVNCSKHLKSFFLMTKFITTHVANTSMNKIESNQQERDAAQVHT